MDCTDLAIGFYLSTNFLNFLPFPLVSTSHTPPGGTWLRQLPAAPGGQRTGTSAMTTP
jgi:hypothetical protein